jgi:hypothetical protein
MELMSISNQDKPSLRFLRIVTLKPRQLEALMLRAQMPAADALTGWEYRGMNLGAGARILGIRKFIKGFCRSTDGQIFGYNVRARQNSPDEAWLAKLAGVERKRFGFYRVLPTNPESRDNSYLNALLLDYGQGGNGRFDITAALRDYLVRISPGSDDLLLGKAFIAVGPLRLPIGYFLLERQCKSVVSKHASDCMPPKQPNRHVREGSNG